MNYVVRIKAVIIKDVEVEADDEEQASEIAHESFDPNCTIGEEHYTEEIVDIKETNA